MPQISFGSLTHIQPSMLHRNPFSYIYSKNNPKNQEPTLPLPYCAVQYKSFERKQNQSQPHSQREK